jgi:hypothetical protein
MKWVKRHWFTILLYLAFGINILGTIYVLILIAGVALFFMPFVETTTLFLNRQFPRKTEHRQIIVASMVGDTAYKFLFMANGKRFINWEDDKSKLRIAAHRDEWRWGDTADVTFCRGLFGIFYLPAQ